MKNFTETTNQQAIEKTVCEAIDKLEIYPLSEDNATILTQLLMSIDMKHTPLPDKEKPHLIKIIENRLSLFTFKCVDFRLPVFLACLSKSPGAAIMILWYLQYWCFVNDRKELDLETLCIQVLPKGFFDDRDLQSVWESQKVKRPTGTFNSDNLVDYPLAGKSIQFKNQ